MFEELAVGEWLAKNGVKLFFAIAILLLVAFGLCEVYSAIYQHGVDAQTLTDAKQIQGLQKNVLGLKDQINQSNELYKKQAIENSNLLSEWMTKYQKAIQDDQVKQTQLKAAAAVAIASNDSLRKSLNVANAKLSSIATSDPAQSTAAQYAATIDTLLDECVTEYRQMAQIADGHAADVAKLDGAWPTKPASMPP